MSTLKPVLRFLVITLVAYLILIFPWPGVHDGYRAAFMTMVHGIYGHIGENGSVRCEAVAITATADVDLYLGKRMPEAGNRIGEAPVTINSRNLGYAPFVFFVSLILATPIPWSRKWRSVVWGLVLLSLFVVFRVGLLIAFWFGAPTEIQLYDTGAFQGLLAKSYEFLVISPGGTFVVTALIWAVVTWRAKDIQTILAKVLPESATPDGRYQS